MFLKRLFCRHKYKFVRKLYGDEINAHDGKRYKYICEKCGMYKWSNVPSVTCEHCIHLCENNDGSVYCDSVFKNGCLPDNTRPFKEVKAEVTSCANFQK